jgi:isopentenyl-diphosphate delta-isomerase
MGQDIIIPAIAADGTLFPIGKLRAHEVAQLHLAVSVFVFDGDALLIQRRALTKYHCGGLWANTCCTHPYWNESPRACAERRLREELGFTLPLCQHDTVEYEADVGGGLTEHERVTLFSANIGGRFLDIRPNPDEVEDVRWITPSMLKEEMQARPETFTPWFRIYFERFPGLLFE